MVADEFGQISISPDEPVYVIGVVSRLVNMPIWTLRILDREKVICPRKAKGKTRYYSLNDIKKLHKVSFYMREKRVNINGVKVILEMETRTFYSIEGER